MMRRVTTIMKPTAVLTAAMASRGALTSATYCLGIPKLLSNVEMRAICQEGGHLGCLAKPLGLNEHKAIETLGEKPASMLQILNTSLTAEDVTSVAGGVRLQHAVLDFNRVDDVMTADSQVNMVKLMLPFLAPNADPQRSLESLTVSVTTKSAPLVPSLLAVVLGAMPSTDTVQPKPSLEHLVLHINTECSTDDVLIPIMTALQRSKAGGMKTLTFSCEGALSCEASKHLLRVLLSPGFQRLEALHLSGVSIQTQGAKRDHEEQVRKICDTMHDVVGSAKVFGYLKELSIDQSNFFEGYRFVSKWAKMADSTANNLESLSLSGVGFGEVGMHSFCKAIAGEMEESGGGTGVFGGKLKRLDMSGCELSATNARYLAKGLSCNGSLETVNLSSCGIDDEVFAALAPSFSLCKQVILRHNKISGTGLQEGLSDSGLGSNRNLEKLVLHSNRLGDAGAKALTSAFRNWKNLKELDCTRCRFTNEELRRLSKNMKHLKSLEVLRLSRNDLRQKNMDQQEKYDNFKLFGASPSGERKDADSGAFAGTYSDADMSANVLHNDAPYFKPFTKVLSQLGPKIKGLDLSDCGLSERSLRYFVESNEEEDIGDMSRVAKGEARADSGAFSTMSSLERLDLVGNQLNKPATGAAMVARALASISATGLQHLELSGVNFGDNAVDSIAAALSKHRHLHELHMSGCRIGDASIKAIAKKAAGHWHSTMRVLNLSENPLVTPDSVVELVAAIVNGAPNGGRGLEVINVMNTSVTPADVDDKLKAMLPPLCKVFATEFSSNPFFATSHCAQQQAGGGGPDGSAFGQPVPNAGQVVTDMSGMGLPFSM